MTPPTEGRPRILVVEDQKVFRKFLAATLESEGFAVTAVEGAEEALQDLARVLPDLVLSDVKMGGMDGRAFCAQLKKTPRTATLPVILLSGNFTDQQDQAEGLEDGADDYLLKPVTGRLLAAKIQSVLRRYRLPRESEGVLKALGLEVNVRARTVSLKGKSIALTRKEFDLLAALLKASGEVLTPDALLTTVWGMEGDREIDTDTIKVHVSSLRKKLGPKWGEALVNVPGVGYKIVLRP